MTNISRRSLLKKSGGAATATAASAFMIIKPELVRGAGNEKLKAGLVGCGGRGTQAVIDMMRGTENVDLVSMGDIFEDKLEGSLRKMQAEKDHDQYKDRIKFYDDTPSIDIYTLTQLVALPI